jgi:hypothetical protein
VRLVEKTVKQTGKNMTAPNNALLYNAAVEGLVAGAIKGRWLTAKNSGTPPAIGTPDPSYAALATQCTALATEVDAAVPNDHAGAAQPAGTQPISVVATGVAIVPSTGAIQFGELIKTKLMAALCLNVLEGRPYKGLPSADFSTIAANIATAYQSLAIPIVQPADFLASVNNQLLYFAVFAGALAGFGLGADSSFPTGNATIDGELLAYAVSLAAAVDALVANDAGISAAAGTGNGGAAKAPEPDAGFTIQISQLGKVRLMFSCTLAYLESRSPLSIPGPTTPSVTAWGTDNAPNIANLYTTCVNSLQTGPVASPVLFNPELWNQAFCGYIAGVMGGRPFTAAADDANYIAVADAAATFAQEVDGAVGASDVAGTPVPTATSPITINTSESPNEPSDIVPTTGTITEAQNAKGGIMWAICRGVMSGRSILGDPDVDTDFGTYANISQSVVALYLELATILNTP